MPTDLASALGKLLDDNVDSEDVKQEIYEAVIGMMLDVAKGNLSMRPEIQEEDHSSEQ